MKNLFLFLTLLSLSAFGQTYTGTTNAGKFASHTIATGSTSTDVPTVWNATDKQFKKIDWTTFFAHLNNQYVRKLNIDLGENTESTIDYVDGTPYLSNSDATTSEGMYMSVSPQSVVVGGTYPTSPGLVGSPTFKDYYTDNSFVQKDWTLAQIAAAVIPVTLQDAANNGNYIESDVNGHQLAYFRNNYSFLQSGYEFLNGADGEMFLNIREEGVVTAQFKTDGSWVGARVRGSYLEGQTVGLKNETTDEYDTISTDNDSFIFTTIESGLTDQQFKLTAAGDGVLRNLFIPKTDGVFAMTINSEGADDYGNITLTPTDIGAGTVSSVTGINGVTVATGTTTPVIGLGAITPTSISTGNFAVSGTVTLPGSATHIQMASGTTQNGTVYIQTRPIGTDGTAGSVADITSTSLVNAALFQLQNKVNYERTQVLTTSAGTYNLTGNVTTQTTILTYTGASNTTWTLPAVTGNSGKVIYLVNQTSSSGQITLNTIAGGNDIYTAGGTQPSATLFAIRGYTLFNNGTSWVLQITD